jgi:hypothetical protein
MRRDGSLATHGAGDDAARKEGRPKKPLAPARDSTK